MIYVNQQKLLMFCAGRFSLNMMYLCETSLSWALNFMYNTSQYEVNTFSFYPDKLFYVLWDDRTLYDSN